LAFANRVLRAEGTWLFGSFIPRELLRHLPEHLAVLAPGREHELRASIERRSRELVDENRDLIVDGPSKGMLGMSAVVLAAYEQLRGVVGDDRRTILFLQHLFVEVLQRSSELATRLLLRRDDPLDAAEQVLGQGTAMYGDAMTFEVERPDADTFEMRVTGCFFERFFAAHDAREVTTVLCAWDANWMRALDPATMGIVAERTSLRSLGDDACRFRVRRTDDPIAEVRDVLPARFGSAGAP
jgi:hypothetical protein